MWPHHISDLKGWGIVSELYGISSIPHAILIDREGNVVATHLRGARLEQELEKLLDLLLWPFTSLLTSTSAPPTRPPRANGKGLLKWLDDVGSQGDSLPWWGPPRLLVRVAPCGAQGGRASVGAHR